MPDRTESMRDSKIERVDRLTSPPVVGRYYLVPCVHGMWCGKIRWWPVTGTLHNDADFFAFKDDHYHLDRRFLPPSAWDWGMPASQPLHARPDVALSSPVLRRKRCLRSEMRFPYQHDGMVRRLQSHYAGQTCRMNVQGFVCPHRHFGLGSVAPDEHGVVTCPLHGLQIGQDGVVRRAAQQREGRAG